MSDETPTLRLDVPGAAASLGGQGGGVPPAGPFRDRKRPSGKGPGAPAIAIIVLSVLVIGAVAFLVWILATKGVGGLAAATPTPTSTSTPPRVPAHTPTPASTPTPTETEQPPAAQPPVFTSLSPQNEVRGCFHRHGGRDQSDNKPEIQVSWSTANATEVWIVQGDSDAANAQFMQLPASGNTSDFPSSLNYDCSQQQIDYTMTMVGSDGQHVSKSWTVSRANRF